MLDVSPACVLRQKRAEDHFKARTRRPPVQRTIRCSELTVDAAYLL
jgi:hypothetical protein